MSVYENLRNSSQNLYSMIQIYNISWSVVFPPESESCKNPGFVFVVVVFKKEIPGTLTRYTEEIRPRNLQIEPAGYDSDVL